MKPTTPETDLAAATERHLLNTVGVAPEQAGAPEVLQAVSQAVREQLSQRWVRTQAGVVCAGSAGCSVARMSSSPASISQPACVQ